MQKALILLVIAGVALVACNKGAGPATAAAPKSGDAVQQKLQELAGNGATDCGRMKTQAPDQLKPATDCALQAAQSKKPFYVAYEMPGLTVGMAGNAEGKLFMLQAAAPENAAPGAAPADIKTAPCPAELRVAQSGRVTCMTPAAMGVTGGANPHGGMAMPPASGENPHGSFGKPPAGTPNPHAAPAPPPTKQH